MLLFPPLINIEPEPTPVPVNETFVLKPWSPIRKPPNTQITQCNCMSAAPSEMKRMRKSSAPRMPKNSTRCWYFAGMPK